MHRSEQEYHPTCLAASGWSRFQLFPIGNARPRLHRRSYHCAMSSRLHCRPCAFELFARQVPAIDASGSAGLLNAALAIAKHEMSDVDCEAVDKQLQGFADTVCERVPHLVEQIRKRQPINP